MTRQVWCSTRPTTGVTAVLFVASLSGYDEVMYEEESENVMHDSLQLFYDICNNPLFIETPMILFLNKRDLFAVKIDPKSESHVPLTVCFPEYTGDMEYYVCAEFIQNQFFAQNRHRQSRKVYTHLTCAMDRENIERVFNDVQHIIIEDSLDAGGLL